MKLSNSQIKQCFYAYVYLNDKETSCWKKVLENKQTLEKEVERIDKFLLEAAKKIGIPQTPEGQIDFEHDEELTKKFNEETAEFVKKQVDVKGLIPITESKELKGIRIAGSVMEPLRKAKLLV
jgi:hypothetical protein